MILLTKDYEFFASIAGTVFGFISGANMSALMSILSGIATIICALSTVILTAIKIVKYIRAWRKGKISTDEMLDHIEDVVEDITKKEEDNDSAKR